MPYNKNNKIVKSHIAQYGLFICMDAFNQKLKKNEIEKIRLGRDVLLDF